MSSAIYGAEPRNTPSQTAAVTTLPMVGRRFLTLTEVQDELNVSPAQAYALIRRGQLPAIKVGGRGQWRVERIKLEEYIERLYAETKRIHRLPSLQRQARRGTEPVSQP